MADFGLYISQYNRWWLASSEVLRGVIIVSSQVFGHLRSFKGWIQTEAWSHITPVLRSLHWLPVTFRIDFKVLLLIYKYLNGLGPKYIADMLTEYKPNRPLSFRVHTKQGESAFSCFATRSWNQLPEEIRCAKTLATFKSRLKTNLFNSAFVEWTLCYIRTNCTIFYVQSVSTLNCFKIILNQILYNFLVFIVVIIINIIIFNSWVSILSLLFLFLYDYFTYFYVKHFKLPLCMIMLYK